MKSVIWLVVMLFANTLWAAGESKPIKIKWVLAHEPVGLFLIAADSFTKEVTEKTKGGVVFEVMTLAEYQTKYNNSKKVNFNDFVRRIQKNEIEMSQTYTTELGRYNNKLYVLDLPFLFRDHAHAQKVLEGQVGETLLAGLAENNLRGLAFTYSGGYRIMPGVKKISKVEDFKGLKVRTSGSPVAQDTFKALGAKPFPMRLDDIDAGIRSGKIEEAESTYARYFPLGHHKVSSIVNETNHSLFLTSIVMNETFWKSLPENYKVIMKEAAITAARLERDHSVKAGEETKKKCLEEGVEIHSLSKEEEAKMKIALEPIYKKYEPILGKELITNIVNQ